MELKSDRRVFLKRTGISAVSALWVAPVTRALAASCGLTPAQTSGPFYPGESKFNPENDLTVVQGRSTRAKGQVIYIRGKVVDVKCAPLVGATVEIWQACESGRYNNSSDTNTAPLDPGFKYWGETVTDANGEYAFKTIIPGAYPADTDWTRPPHVHFKVSKLGYKELVTQMYFKGQALNDKDLILQAVPADERASVIVDFTPSSATDEPGALSGSFDITLEPVKAR